MPCRTTLSSDSQSIFSANLRPRNMSPGTEGDGVWASPAQGGASLGGIFVPSEMHGSHELSARKGGIPRIIALTALLAHGPVIRDHNLRDQYFYVTNKYINFISAVFRKHEMD